MKLSKTKKFFLLGTSLGVVLTTSIATPFVVQIYNKNNKIKQKNKISKDQKDVNKIIEILEEKSSFERQIILSKKSTGKIIANNQDEIITKIKTLNGKSNLKEAKIEILMKKDQDISSNFQKIQIKVSKGKYSKIIDSEKVYFVKKEQNEQEIIADVNSVKNALDNLKTKTLELQAKENDKSTNGNKDAILNTLKQIEGYSEIDFKEVKIKVKKDLNNLPGSNASPISITFILSKANVCNVEVTSFKIKQLANQKIIEIKKELNQIKSNLENLETKEVKVYVSDKDKTITHNKIAIESAIENLNGYDAIEFNLASLEVKNSSNNLPTNDQVATSITLILSKNNVKVEIQGFSAKQTQITLTQDKINQIKQKIKHKDILIPFNVSTQNQSEIQDAIKNQLQKENPLLTNGDISKISTSLPNLTFGNRTKVTIIIKIKSTNSPLKICVEKINLLKNSNIIRGNEGAIFQDEFKNLWTMGRNQKLQALRANQNQNGYINTGWTDTIDKGLTKNSNIDNGEGGTIFQDKFKNLWSMGSGTSLQVLKVNSQKNGYDEITGWTNVNDSGLTKNSNISSGWRGTIFQDQFKNLWAMGNGTSLQVLRVNQNGDGYNKVIGWNSANDSGILLNSNITNGNKGAIFQDQFKNLWAMGDETSLQVLRANQNGDGYVSTGWNSENDKTSGDPLLKKSNITNGGGGKIFQDQFKNLWAMGNGTSLQVLRVNQNGDGYVSTGWNSDNDKTSGNPLLKKSNITNGVGGTIFQDQFKNLWAMGNGTSLQVLRVNQNGDGYVSTGWTNDNDKTSGNPLLKKSNITNGVGGTIFQDQFKNLWAMAHQTSLQVLRVNQNGDGYVSTGWTSANNQLIKGSKIIFGKQGIIFQDEFKNLWAMGLSTAKNWKITHTKLQVLKINLAKNGYVDSWQ